MMKYGLVENGKVINVRKVDETDALLIKKMTAHGYLPIEVTVQSFDPYTQNRGELSYIIFKDKITVSFTMTYKTITQAKKNKTRQFRNELEGELGKSYEQVEVNFIMLCGTVAQKTALKTMYQSMYEKLNTAKETVTNAKSVSNLTDMVVKWNE